ncbi:hypothetical protein [Clostridium luticellarii]|jgi:hypothetical protein|uniref:Uncharacterized protein n=1 Tax=Clostridium luticellarii TaxID=1691940 RepID=A0A2T0BPW4_9CLOT|nr:hypothetical protein [Clostridium luticellarii]PRR85875.1 hypothetical protein CLLU_10790 [Clostridium luticellarii]
MLNIPLGKLVVCKNDIKINYIVFPQPLKVIDKCNYYVDARYLILVDTRAIKAGDKIKCFIDCENVETYINGGEYLVLLDFIKDNVLISLGGYEILYNCDDKNFAFDIYYIKNGLGVYFIDTKYVEKFKLAISWMNLETKRNELSTWYASDPFLCKK